jgi:hypothetical protein
MFLKQGKSLKGKASVSRIGSLLKLAAVSVALRRNLIGFLGPFKA